MCNLDVGAFSPIRAYCIQGTIFYVQLGSDEISYLCIDAVQNWKCKLVSLVWMSLLLTQKITMSARGQVCWLLRRPPGNRLTRVSPFGPLTGSRAATWRWTTTTLRRTCTTSGSTGWGRTFPTGRGCLRSWMSPAERVGMKSTPRGPENQSNFLIRPLQESTSWKLFSIV